MILPFKSRVLDRAKPVLVYRNLNGDQDHLYSLKQGALVVGHSNRLTLKQVTFHVSEAGRRRVLKTRQKNVHAFIKGYVKKDSYPAFGNRVTYNPYYDETFIYRDRDGFPAGPIRAARTVRLVRQGVFAMGAISS